MASVFYIFHFLLALNRILSALPWRVGQASVNLPRPLSAAQRPF